MKVINADGRRFVCQVVDPPSGFTVEADQTDESCVLSHPGLDYETVAQVTMKVRVGLEGQPWSNQSGAGYHSEANVSHTSSHWSVS